jgi:hypothetical protein
MQFANQIAIALTRALNIHSVDSRGSDIPVHPRVTLPETEVRYLHSSIVGDTFEVSVALPRNY